MPLPPWGTHLPVSPSSCPCSLVHLLGTALLTGPSQEAALSLRLPTCNMKDAPTNTPAESGRGMGYTNHQMLRDCWLSSTQSHSPWARCLWTPPPSQLSSEASCPTFTTSVLEKPHPRAGQHFPPIHPGEGQILFHLPTLYVKRMPSNGFSKTKFHHYLPIM